jgi:hypothetical protein
MRLASRTYRTYSEGTSRRNGLRPNPADGVFDRCQTRRTCLEPRRRALGSQYVWVRDVVGVSLGQRVLAVEGLTPQKDVLLVLRCWNAWRCTDGVQVLVLDHGLEGLVTPARQQASVVDVDVCGNNKPPRIGRAGQRRAEELAHPAQDPVLPSPRRRARRRSSDPHDRRRVIRLAKAQSLAGFYSCVSWRHERHAGSLQVCSAQSIARGLRCRLYRLRRAGSNG